MDTFWGFPKKGDSETPPNQKIRPSSMGDPQARWMVYFMENPRKWMMIAGPPHDFGNLHMEVPKNGGTPKII